MDGQKAVANGVSGQTQKSLADFDPPKKAPTNKYALGCAILASLSSILLGYDIGVMSGAQIYIQEDLHISDTQVEILVGILNLFSLVGSLAAGRTSDWLGRRNTIVFAAAIFFTGALLMGFATTYAFLMVGRFVAGVGVGYALMIAPVYTAEVSPASTRGFLVSFPEVFINGGILLGYVSNYGFSKLPVHLSWRFMLGIGVVPSIFLAVGVLAMPESPRWLVMQGRLGDAKKVLNKTSDSKEEAEFRLADIKAAAHIPLDCQDDVIAVPKRVSHGSDVWKELLVHPTPSVRHILIAAIGIHFFQQASGIDAVVLYSPKIFEKAGIKSDNQKLLATIAVGFVKTLFILVATFLLDRIGRRRLLLTSVGGMIASLATLGIALTVIDHSDTKLMWAVGLCICMVLAYVATFSIGMGPITWVYSSEIFPLKLRAQGTSLGVVTNRVISGTVSMSFISLYKAITIGGSFFLYAGIASVAWIFFYFLLPETQGRTLEDMEELFGNLCWKFDQKKKNENLKGGNVEDTGVMSGAQMYIQDDLHLSDTQVEILVGIINLYSLVGSLAAGRTSDWLGRRSTIVFTAAIFFTGALLMGFATNYAFLMFGRFVAGVGVGYALMIAPVYTAELCSASTRGFLVSFPEVFINGGLLLGYVSNYGFSKLPTHLGWRFMLGIGVVPSIFLAVAVLVMPESPRWLVMQGRLGDAKKVLNKTSDSKEEAEFRLADIKAAAHIPLDCQDDVVAVPKRVSHGSDVWKELFVHPTPSVRHILIACIGIHFFQQSSGIDAVVLYSPRIFEKAGIKSDDQKLLATIAVGFSKTIFVLVATFLLDRVGRRPLLLTSAGGMIASLATLGIALTVIEHSDTKLLWAIGLCICMVLACVAVFSIGMGPIAWVYSSEIFPLKLRAQGTSLGVVTNRVISGTVGMSFISLYKAITIGGAFFLFAGIASVAWIFFYFLLPETQGRTLEEMEVLFGNLCWKFDQKKNENLKGGNVEGEGNGHVQLGARGCI
ncbi:Major facilitator, sugar transporter-like [Dillenia turbinata]|uniref:Major facilitator, sugar transporter-like n=1 Tax=Dillenia turbinata TaxID=194707 RepID=A0AAN8ZQU1_9MAGN